MSSRRERKSGGARKIGRNKVKCELYKKQGKREINKKRKQEKHLKKLQKKQQRKENVSTKVFS